MMLQIFKLKTLKSLRNVMKAFIDFLKLSIFFLDITFERTPKYYNSHSLVLHNFGLNVEFTTVSFFPRMFFFKKRENTKLI